MRSEGEIANLILQAFICRRIGIASQDKMGVTLIGYEGDAETLKLQRFFRRNGYPPHDGVGARWPTAALVSHRFHFTSIVPVSTFHPRIPIVAFSIPIGNVTLTSRSSPGSSDT